MALEISKQIVEARVVDRTLHFPKTGDIAVKKVTVVLTIIKFYLNQ